MLISTVSESKKKTFINMNLNNYFKFLTKLKPVYKIIILLIVLLPISIYIYFNYIKAPELGSERYISNYTENDDEIMEGKKPEDIVREVLAGKSLRADAPVEYKSDDATFKLIYKIRNGLATYYETNKSYPKTLNEVGENGTELVNRGIIYIRDNDSYTLTVKFETEEAVLVGANVKYNNKNIYSLEDKTVTFTQLSGNFFNFTGSTIK